MCHHQPCVHLLQAAGAVHSMGECVQSHLFSVVLYLRKGLAACIWYLIGCMHADCGFSASPMQAAPRDMFTSEGSGSRRVSSPLLVNNYHLSW